MTNVLFTLFLFLITGGILFGASTLLDIWDVFSKDFLPHKRYIPIYSALAKITPRALVYFSLALPLIVLLGLTFLANEGTPDVSLEQYRIVQTWLLIMLMASAFFLSVLREMCNTIGERLGRFVLKHMKHPALGVENKPS